MRARHHLTVRSLQQATRLAEVTAQCLTYLLKRVDILAHSLSSAYVRGTDPGAKSCSRVTSRQWRTEALS
eukprot:3981996-Amphidinium_carterae.2